MSLYWEFEKSHSKGKPQITRAWKCIQWIQISSIALCSHSQRLGHKIVKQFGFIFCKIITKWQNSLDCKWLLMRCQSFVVSVSCQVFWTSLVSSIDLNTLTFRCGFWICLQQRPVLGMMAFSTHFLMPKYASTCLYFQNCSRVCFELRCE